mmetsp:Transcript_25318/g.64364  ORF Transcript_25318/g.64364 Transcript_25318/m.64364 type:complete len:226 (-) Transcript_25318:234-911(-)
MLADTAADQAITDKITAGSVAGLQADRGGAATWHSGGNLYCAARFPPSQGSRQWARTVAVGAMIAICQTSASEAFLRKDTVSVVAVAEEWREAYCRGKSVFPPTPRRVPCTVGPPLRHTESRGRCATQSQSRRARSAATLVRLRAQTIASARDLTPRPRHRRGRTLTISTDSRASSKGKSVDVGEVPMGLRLPRTPATPGWPRPTHTRPTAPKDPGASSLVRARL